MGFLNLVSRRVVVRELRFITRASRVLPLHRASRLHSITV